MAAERISAQQAHTDVSSGNAMLVCGYDIDEQFRLHRLTEAMSMVEFRKRADSLPTNQEIIFYCS